MMSMPVTVRLTWSPAAAQSRASSWRVIPVAEINRRSKSLDSFSHPTYLKRFLLGKVRSETPTLLTVQVTHLPHEGSV